MKNHLKYTPADETQSRIIAQRAVK